MHSLGIEPSTIGILKIFQVMLFQLALMGATCVKLLRNIYSVQ